jgi:hypothetical protein
MLEQKDARVGVTHEVLAGIRIIKLRALELFLGTKINQVCMQPVINGTAFL